MALKEPFMVKSDFSLGADESLELEAKSGESLLVKDVLIIGANDEYAILEIDKTTVGFFRVDGHPLGSHLSCNITKANASVSYMGFKAERSITLLSYMIRQGWMSGYPVAEGQTFRVKPYTTGKKLNRVAIIYEKYDAGDIKSTDVNGSESKEYLFVNYGRCSSDLEEAGDYEVNQTITTEEFPDFPFGKSVPSKTTVEVLAILGSEAIKYTDSNTYTYTKYLKMFKGRTCLFDVDKQGLPMYQYVFSGISAGEHYARGFSVIGNYTTRDRREPFVLPQPLVFNEGDEVNVYISTGQGTNADTLSAKTVEIAFIERVKVAE